MKLIDCVSVHAPTIHSDVFMSHLFFFSVELVLNVNVFYVCSVFQPLTRLFATWICLLCFIVVFFFFLMMGCSVGMSFMSGTQPDFFALRISAAQKGTRGFWLHY